MRFDGYALVSEWQREHFIRAFWLEPSRTAVLRNAIAPVFWPIICRRCADPAAEGVAADSRLHEHAVRGLQPADRGISEDSGSNSRERSSRCFRA